MRNIQQLIVALIIMALAACGGGGTLDSGGGTGGNTTPVYSLSVVLTNASGDASTALAQDTPLTVTATLSATNGGTVSNQVISFSVNDDELATFSNDAGSALTNSDGVAIIELVVGNKSGAGNLTAAYNAVNASTGFNSAGDGDGRTDVTVSSLTLLADKLQLGSGGTDKVELFAIVKDDNNVLVPNASVSFSSSPSGALGGELTIVNTITGDDGVAVAELKSAIDPSLRQIAVTANAGSISQTININVVGTAIDVSAPTAMVIGSSRTISVLVRDFDGVALPNQTLTLSSALDNTFSSTTLTSNNVGQAEVTYTAVNSGADEISISGLGITQVTSINVSADEFEFVALSSNEVNLNTVFPITLTWSKDGVAQANQPVTFVTTRGNVFAEESTPLIQTEVSKNTDASGNVTVYVRSTSAGLATIRAESGEGSELITSELVLEFVADTVNSMSVQASPSQLGVNEQSSIRAIVLDANNNPVKNKTVSFVLTGAAGGTINPASSITNSQGIASTVFTATSPTGSNEVVVTANVDGVSANTRLSVGERTLFFRFGTGNTIEIVSQSLFKKEFSVVVTDASGNPVVNQTLNISVTPVTPKNVAAPLADEWAYAKGTWIMVPNSANFEYWAPQISSVELVADDPATPAVNEAVYQYTLCQNEDSNLNGNLDAGEDFNNDGSLTPGNVVVVQQDETTDENGIAIFNLTYPADYAAWTHVNITVSALASGTESRSSRKYQLSYPGSYVSSKTAAPAANPFGKSTSCGDTF